MPEGALREVRIGFAVLKDLIYPARAFLKPSVALALLLMFASILSLSRPASSETPTDVYARIKPSLALVETFSGKRLLGIGSGFCISSSRNKSIFITNRHVVAGGDHFVIFLQFPSRKAYAATPLKVSKGILDIALLSVPHGDIPSLTIDVTNPREGDLIGIAGYPKTQLEMLQDGYGLTPSLHLGTINALPAKGFYIQYDAQTEPGNSGGPLFDQRTGYVRGIVVAKFGNRESNLAISIALIHDIVEQSKVILTLGESSEVERVAIKASLGNTRPVTPDPPQPRATTVVDPSCTSALSEFNSSYEAWRGAFNRYITSSNNTSSGLSGVTNRYGAIGAQVSAGYELKAIHSVIDAEEPKLNRSNEELSGTRGVDSAQLVDRIVRNIRALDFDLLNWSQQRYNLLGNLAGGGSGYNIDQSSQQDARRLQSEIDQGFADLRYSQACTFVSEVSAARIEPETPIRGDITSGTYVGPIWDNTAGPGRMQLTIQLVRGKVSGTFANTFTNSHLNNAGSIVGKYQDTVLQGVAKPSVDSSCPFVFTVTLSSDGTTLNGTYASSHCKAALGGRISVSLQ